MIVTGNPATIEAHLNSRAGRATALAIAEAIFADEDRLAAWETALGGDLHPAIERELERLVARRNKDHA